MPEKLEIGLTGFYGRGNFGDDLVGAILGRHLADHGHRCTVLGFDEPLAGALGLATTRDAVALVERSQAIVLGGGSALGQASGRRFSRSIRRHLGEDSTLMDIVIRECARRGKPLFAISVGGDGTPFDRLTPRQHALLRACSGATVRNPEAVALYQAVGCAASCYPDIVLQTARHFPRTPRPVAQRPVVGIDVYWSNLLARRALFTPLLLRSMVLRRPDVSFVYLDSTHRDHAPFLAVGPPRRAANAGRYQFHDLHQDLDRIASLDLVLSTRLHVGVAALSYGVPFMSLFGEPKTALFLHHTGLERAYFTPANVNEFLRAAHDPVPLAGWLRGDLPETVQDAIERSAGHLLALDAMLAPLLPVKSPAKPPDLGAGQAIP